MQNGCVCGDEEGGGGGGTWGSKGEEKLFARTQVTNNVYQCIAYTCIIYKCMVNKSYTINVQRCIAYKRIGIQMCRVQIVCKCTYVYHIQRQRYSHTHRYQMMYTNVFNTNILCTGWRRLIGSPTLQIIFHKRATKYRSLLREMSDEDKGSYESSLLYIPSMIRIERVKQNIIF